MTCLRSVKGLTRRANQRHSAIIAETIGKPATEFPSRAFSIGNPAELGENVVARSSLTPHFWGAVPSRHIRGNRDEEAAGGYPDRRVFHFIPGQGGGARRRCCARRSVGSRCSGSRRGRRGSIHRIFGRAIDRAFLGTAALRISSPRARRTATRYGSTTQVTANTSPPPVVRAAEAGAGEPPRATCSAA